MVHRHVARTHCPSNQSNLWEPRYQRVHRHISSPDLTRKYVKIQQPNNQLEAAIVSSYVSCPRNSPFNCRIDWKSIIKAIVCRVINLGCHGFYICGKEHWILALFQENLGSVIKEYMPLEETNKHYIHWDCDQHVEKDNPRRWYVGPCCQ